MTTDLPLWHHIGLVTCADYQQHGIDGIAGCGKCRDVRRFLREASDGEFNEWRSLEMAENVHVTVAYKVAEIAHSRDELFEIDLESVKNSYFRGEGESAMIIYDIACQAVRDDTTARIRGILSALPTDTLTVVALAADPETAVDVAAEIKRRSDRKA